MMRGMRALLGVCLFVILGLIAISTFSSGPPTTSTALHSLVTQTHHQLNQLHKLKEELEGEQPLDNAILIDLGFVDHPILSPNHSWFNISTPVIVTAISWRKIHLLPDFIEVAQAISVNVSLVIYSIDLTEDQIKDISIMCNETCEILSFEFSNYPSHIRDLHLEAYRPIIIQEMLQRSGIVLWMDPCMQLVESSVNMILGDQSLLDLWTNRSYKNGGVLTWPLLHPAPHLPTAALTHPDMFSAFRTQKNFYDFQKMANPQAVLVVNTPMIHYKLMRPWVRCALTSSCLSPIGAQDTGCIYNKKPLFRYSGCHLYDTSAFNVALGLAFGIDNESYLEPTELLECWTEAITSESSPSLESSPADSKFQTYSSFSGNLKQTVLLPYKGKQKHRSKKIKIYIPFKNISWNSNDRQNIYSHVRYFSKNNNKNHNNNNVEVQH